MNNTFLILLLAATLSATGCASKTQLAKLESSKWTELTCSGFLTWHACRQEARSLCPDGFYTADYYENYLIQRRVVSVACKA